MPLVSKVISLFFPSSSQSCLFRQISLPCWLCLQHMVTTCCCTCKISFLKNVQPSSALQECLPRDSVNQTPEQARVSALWEPEVAVLTTPLLTSPRSENYPFMIALPRIFSDHHITHHYFSVHKPQVQQVPSLVFHLIVHVRGHTFQEPPRVFLPWCFVFPAENIMLVTHHSLHLSYNHSC